MAKHFIIILWINALFTWTVHAQVLNPVKWQYAVVKETDDNYTLKFTAKIDNNWHLYSQNIPEGGPIPTSFSFEKNAKYELIDKVKEISKAEVKFDESFSMNLKIFSKEAVFVQKIKAKTSDPFVVKGVVEFMSCDNQRCLPPKQIGFSFDIPAHQTVKKLVTDTPAIASEKKPSDTIVEPAKTSAAMPGQSDKASSNDGSLWQFFLIAFGAGIIGLFTPCVYPMIPMTVSFFMRGEEKKSAGILKGLIFGLSIVFIYTMLGIVVAITKSGAGISTVISTHWIPNLIFFLLFLVFAISFFGMFEIVLPGSLANKIDQQVDKGGYAASFFMALTLVVVSFSCTAPFVGSILVEASRGLAVKPIIGMLGYSLAFAIPFMIFAISPALMKKLAKSGSWLNSVKVVMAFVLLAFSLKFLLAIDTTHHFNILTREVYLSVWIVIFSMLGFYLMGKIKFAHDSDLLHIGVPRLMLAIIAFSFVVYMIPGLFGAPLNSISSMLPPSSRQSFFNTTSQGSAAKLAENMCENPKYADILELPFGLKGYFDYEEGMACARKQNKPVLLDFKGHTCSNCKKMEGGVFSNPEILERLNNNFVIIALYTDDALKLPEKEWAKSTYDGEVKRTMGAKNLDFEITKFNINTQPLYAILDNQGNQLNNTMEFNMNVDVFKKFLDEGKEKFYKK